MGGLTEDEPLRGIRVLVAEDNTVNQRILKLLLGTFGAEVTIVSNGIKAVKQVKVQDFDLILMDLSMPGLMGHEATEQIRAIEGPVGQIPIIAVTAHAMGSDLDAAFEAGMNGYVQKPIAAATLVEAVLKVLPSTSQEIAQPAQ